MNEGGKCVMVDLELLEKLECECYIGSRHEDFYIEKCDLCRATPALIAELRGLRERVKERDEQIRNVCKRALNYAENVGKAEGCSFDDDDDLPAIQAALNTTTDTGRAG